MVSSVVVTDTDVEWLLALPDCPVLGLMEAGDWLLPVAEFLLFAEARGLVPLWHPTYRDGYTIEALRSFVERQEHARGVWESLQAIARLAHRGCRAGTLRVPPFNGRLFSPSAAPLAESLSLDDAPVRRALLALTTRRGKAGRERIAYADLGVEQLGAVYEHILDFVPARRADGTFDLCPSGRRKATGTFYTPRPLTEYLVRRALAPLVEHGSPDDILRLRILDPAMGSGAFLVAACRYLGHAYEQAIVQEAGITAADISDADRTAFRRTIAQRCLFGVDINPMAVQLARLSLWLATLAGDRPLTFLDHHLRTGDSLIGASLADIHRQPPAGGKNTRITSLPLFAVEDLQSGLRAIVPSRVALAGSPDDTLEQVRQKERALAELVNPGSPLDRWKTVADLWCAAWFSARLNGRMFDALVRHAVDGQGPLPAHTSAPLLQEARSAAADRAFFHWTLEFPEVFYSEDGLPLHAPGFDAILGNPPWEMLRRNRASTGPSAGVAEFVRESGIYRLQGKGHSNLYQLFIERSLSLLKRGGRLGSIVPSGLSTDHGCSRLRHALFENTTIDTFMTLENRDGIFPIHRALKFTLFTLTSTGRTDTLYARSGVRAVEALDRLGDTGTDPDAVPLPLPLLRRVSGDDLAVPEILSREDLDLVSQITFTFPALGDAEGWGLQFGRELNASDDRPHFIERTGEGSGLPIVEGKHVQPFRVDVAAARYRIAHADLPGLMPAHQRVLRPRLAYRDVASPSNRLTLIAAIVPGGVVTIHTLFCVKDPPDLRSQYFLCGIFNSFVANYLVRMRVGTHVTAALVERLAVPKPAAEGGTFREIAGLARRLTRGSGDAPRLQALVARLYGLSDASFAHVLGKFPLVSREERDAALSAFRCIVR